MTAHRLPEPPLPADPDDPDLYATLYRERYGDPSQDRHPRRRRTRGGNLAPPTSPPDTDERTTQ